MPTKCQITPLIKSKQISIGFFHHYGLGDSVVALKALYLAKKAYNCRLIIFGNATFKNLLEYCKLIDKGDEIVDIGFLSKECIKQIASHKVDYFYLSNPKKEYIKLLSKLNTPIITALKFPSLFCPKAKHPPLYFLMQYRKMSMQNALCALVRCIDKDAFDSFVASILAHHRLKNLAGGGDTLKSTNRLKTKQNTTQKTLKHQITYVNFERKMDALDSVIQNDIKLESSPTKEVQDFLATMRKNMQNLNHSLTKPFMIFINPFSNAATHTLPLSAFLELMTKILEIPKSNICVLVITYPAVHSEFMAEISKQKALKEHKSRLFIYANDNSLSNLIFLSSLANLIISPSTGTIHIASNLGVKTIGLYSKKDRIRWATRDKRYVIIPKAKQYLTNIQCENIINQTLHHIQEIM